MKIREKITIAVLLVSNVYIMPTDGGLAMVKSIETRTKAIATLIVAHQRMQPLLTVPPLELALRSRTECRCEIPRVQLARPQE